MQTLKVVFCGYRGCGKSTLIQSHFNTEFVDEVQDYPVLSSHVMYKYIPVKMDLWDVPENDRRENYAKTDIFLVCFSVCHRLSLEKIWEDYYSDIKKYSPDAKIILVGTKSDTRKSKELLAQDYKSERKMHFVTPLEAINFAVTIGAQAYIECSTYEFRNVNEVFNLILSTNFGPVKQKESTSGNSIVSLFKNKMKKISGKWGSGGQADKKIYDILPKTIVRDVLSYLEISDLVSLAQVNRLFREISYDPILWERHAKEIDTIFTIEKNGDPRKFMMDCRKFWLNDFSTPPQPVPTR